MSPSHLPKIPSVGELLENPSLRSLVERINHSTLVSAARTVLDELRGEVQTMASERTLPDVGELAERIAKRIMEKTPPRARSVVNATGILFHPELGRPPLAEGAVEAMAAAARGFVDEPRLGGEKHVAGESVAAGLLRELTSAERAAAFSSIAAATALTMAALCGEDGLGGVELDGDGELRVDGELVVARGHVVDFGGEYSIAGMAAAAGVWLNEIGAANRTRVEDYVEAISGRTSAVLYVDDGRFAMRGFAARAALKEVVGAAHARKIPVVAHLDGGTLLDGATLGLPAAASVRAALAAGADLVVFRGDRLLGGPQSGLIAGRRALVERIEQHPLAAACRLDDCASAALAATLQCYTDPERAGQEIPLLQLLTSSADNLKNRCERLAPQLAACAAVKSVEVRQGVASLSGYNLPGDELVSWQIEVEPAASEDEKNGGGQSPLERLAAALLKGEPAVVAKRQGGRLVIDLRSVLPRQDMEIAAAFEAVGRGAGDRGTGDRVTG